MGSDCRKGSAEGSRGREWVGIRGCGGVAGHPFPSAALEIPQYVGDDVVLGFLVQVPDCRWQLGALSSWSVRSRGPSRTPHLVDLQK